MDTLSLIFNNDIITQIYEVMQNSNNTYETSRFINDIENQKINDMDYMFPYLFINEFREIDTETMNRLCQCSVLSKKMEGIGKTLFQDSMDAINKNHFLVDKIQSILLLNQFQVSIMCSLFNESSKFWTFYNKYQEEFFEALRLIENKNKSQVVDFKEGAFIKITRGIKGLRKCSISAMACLSNCEYKIRDINEAIDFEGEAVQLFEDLRKWKNDFEQKNYSWFLTRIMKENDIGPDTSLSEVSRILYSQDYDTDILRRINDLCEMALMRVGKAGEFAKSIGLFQGRCDKLYKDLDNLKGNSNKLNKIPLQKKNVLSYGVENFVQNMIDIVSIQQSKGYMELAQWGVLPKSMGFTGKDEMQRGDVFQRAFVLNIMLELKNMGYRVKENMIEMEIEYLLSKWDETKGGWCYFPNLPESLPDLDILAEMIELFILTKDDFLKEMVKASLRGFIGGKEVGEELLDKWVDCKNEMDIDKISADKMGTDEISKDGFIFELSESGEVDIKKSSIDINNGIWGESCDLGSNARILDLLLKENMGIESDILKKKVYYLLNNKKDYNNLENTSYLSTYYISFLFSKILRKFSIANESEKLISYILDTQNEDSFWGDERGVMDTAFALLALLEQESVIGTKKLMPLLKKGIESIGNFFGESGFFSGCEFSKFIIKDNEGNLIEQIYKSSTFTSIVCAYTLGKLNFYIKSKDDGVEENAQSK